MIERNEEDVRVEMTWQIRRSGRVAQPYGRVIYDMYKRGLLDHSTCLHVIANLLSELPSCAAQSKATISKE